MVMSVKYVYVCFFFSMMRRPPKSTQSRSSAASDVYKRQGIQPDILLCRTDRLLSQDLKDKIALFCNVDKDAVLSLIHISEPTRPY